MSNKTLESTLQILAAVLLGVAAIFLWLGNYEGVFIASALSSASYFLSYRYQVKDRLDKRETERFEKELDEMNLNRNMLQEHKSLFEIEETDLETEREEILNEK